MSGAGASGRGRAPAPGPGPGPGPANKYKNMRTPTMYTKFRQMAMTAGELTDPLLLQLHLQKNFSLVYWINGGLN